MGSLRKLEKERRARVRVSTGFQIMRAEWAAPCCLDWNGMPPKEHRYAQDSLDAAYDRNPYESFFYETVDNIPEEFDDASYCLWNTQEQRWIMWSKVSVIKKTRKHEIWAKENRGE